MSTAALKRELALLRNSLAALTPSQSARLDDPIAWAERTAGLTLDPWQRDVLLSAAPRLLLQCYATKRQVDATCPKDLRRRAHVILFGRDKKQR